MILHSLTKVKPMINYSKSSTQELTNIIKAASLEIALRKKMNAPEFHPEHLTIGRLIDTLRNTGSLDAPVFRSDWNGTSKILTASDLCFYKDSFRDGGIEYSTDFGLKSGFYSGPFLTINCKLL